MSMNMVILTGRLTADPEAKATQTGKSYAKFSLAVTRNYNREETDFINVVAWEKKAELVSQYLHKGSLVGVTGSMRVRTYEDDKQQKRKITEVVMDSLEFLDSKKSEGSAPAVASEQPKTTADETDFPF